MNNNSHNLFIVANNNFFNYPHFINYEACVNLTLLKRLMVFMIYNEQYEGQYIVIKMKKCAWTIPGLGMAFTACSHYWHCIKWCVITCMLDKYKTIVKRP